MVSTFSNSGYLVAAAAAAAAAVYGVIFWYDKTFASTHVHASSSAEQQHSIRATLPTAAMLLLHKAETM